VPGVIWKGDTLIEGVPETLDYLRSKARRGGRRRARRRRSGERSAGLVRALRVR
jgi:hypothetical protein